MSELFLIEYERTPQGVSDAEKNEGTLKMTLPDDEESIGVMLRFMEEHPTMNLTLIRGEVVPTKMTVTLEER